MAGPTSFCQHPKPPEPLPFGEDYGKAIRWAEWHGFHGHEFKPLHGHCESCMFPPSHTLHLPENRGHCHWIRI